MTSLNSLPWKPSHVTIIPIRMSHVPRRFPVSQRVIEILKTGSLREGPLPSFQHTSQGADGGLVSR